MAEHMARMRSLLKAALVCTPLLWPVAASAEPCRIAVLGDSLTAAFGLEVADGFPARLQRALDAEGYACEVLDAGVSGDTSAGGLARLDWMLADQPSHVIVELGANDALRAVPPEETLRNLDGILTRLEAEGIPVLLAGMLAPPNLGRTYGQAFAAVYTDLAERHEVPLYPFFLDGVAGQPTLNQRDGIHPTAEGVAVIVGRMLPTVIAWLGDAAG